MAGRFPAGFRFPTAGSAPLVTHTPYFSTWTMSDTTTGDWSKHWTGAVNANCGMIRIDGTTYRYMAPQPDAAPPLKQTSVEVTPTRTTYRSGGWEENELGLTFLSPLLPKSLDILARPGNLRDLGRESDRRAGFIEYRSTWMLPASGL